MTTPTFPVGDTNVRNVIAQTRTGSPERVVMAGAHNGSTHYVETLCEDDRDRIAFYLNVDMVASPNPGYLVQGGEGNGSGSGPDGSATVARVLVEQLAAAGVTAETTRFEGGSVRAWD